MKLEDIFIDAAKRRKVCRLIDKHGNERLGQPYMIYKSSTGKRCYHFYQISGYSVSGETVGWKNPEVSTIREIVIEEGDYSVHPQYNPFNVKMFRAVEFSLPNKSGQQRK